MRKFSTPGFPSDLLCNFADMLTKAAKVKVIFPVRLRYSDGHYKESHLFSEVLKSDLGGGGGGGGGGGLRRDLTAKFITFQPMPVLPLTKKNTIICLNNDKDVIST